MEALWQLLAAPVIRRWLAAAVLGQLAWCMAPIAMLVIGDQVLGSVAAGARLAGLLTLATAFCAPLWGRLMDVHGIVGALRRAAWLSAAGTLALAGILLIHVPAPVLGAPAIVLGAALAPMPAAFRALLPNLVERSQLAAASNLDAVRLEIALIGGPALVAGLSLIPAGGATLLLAGIAAASAACALAAGRLPEVPRRSAIRTSSGHRQRMVLGILAAALVFGLSGGLLETAVFADIDRRGASPAAAAGALALVGVGSAIGGLAAALRPPPASARTAGYLMAGYSAGTLLAATADPLWLVVSCLFAAGVPVAPVNSVGAMALERHTSATLHSTSFTLAAGGLTLGAGLGQLLGGTIIDTAGGRVAFLAAGLVPAALAGLLLARAADGRSGR